MIDDRPLIHIIGAGVIGCTCAIALAETKRYRVKISARDLPTDFDSQSFASPWAGASFRSIAGHDERWQKWDAFTFNVFKKLMKEYPDMFQTVEGSQLFREPLQEDPWFSTFHSGYARLTTQELKPGFVDGYKYDSITINTPKYLKYLKKRLDELDVVVERRHVHSINECFTSQVESEGTPSVVVNCTGLGAKSLLGVEDPKVRPIKGQTILIKGPPGYSKCVNFDMNYIIPRPGGTIILGGCVLEDDWSLHTDFTLAQSIVDACVGFDPTLSQDGSGNVDVIRHNVGLRPGRLTGPRLESEVIQSSNNDEAKQGVVVHAYGIGGSGYQSSWGMAEGVCQLVNAAIDPSASHNLTSSITPMTEKQSR